MPEVKIRAMEPQDLDLLYTIENDTALWRVGCTNVPYSRYALHQYIANASGDIYLDGQVRLMIDDAEGRAVGVLDLVNFNPRHLRAEVGIVISSTERRKGYARAALERTIIHAREILHLHQLYAVVDCLNEDSLHLFRRMGFRDGMVLPEWLYDGSKYRDALLMQYIL